MKKCPACGTENPDEAKYCVKCGAELSPQTVAPGSQASISKDVPQGEPLEGEVISPGTGKSSSSGTGGGSKVWIWILVGVGVLLVLSVACCCGLSMLGYINS